MCLNAPIIIVLISILIMTVFLKHAKKVGPARGTGLLLLLLLLLLLRLFLASREFVFLVDSVFWKELVMHASPGAALHLKAVER